MEQWILLIYSVLSYALVLPHSVLTTTLLWSALNTLGKESTRKINNLSKVTARTWQCILCHNMILPPVQIHGPPNLEMTSSDRLVRSLSPGSYGFIVGLPLSFLLTKQWRPKRLSNLSKHGGIKCLEEREPLGRWSEEHHSLLAHSLQHRPNQTWLPVLSPAILLFLPSRILLHFLCVFFFQGRSLKPVCIFCFKEKNIQGPPSPSLCV